MPEPLHLLVVDDEPDIEALFAQRFKRERKDGSLRMSFAHSGEEALVRLHEDARPDCVLILSDIHMPGMNGLELLRRVKSEEPEMRVLMIALPGEESECRAREYGADDCVTKPLDFDDLRRKVFEQ
jgi:CheY-like chemotaxis protein